MNSITNANWKPIINVTIPVVCRRISRQIFPTDQYKIRPKRLKSIKGNANDYRIFDGLTLVINRYNEGRIQ